jgi:hypothetical protein
VFDFEGAEFRIDEPTEQTHVKLAWTEFKNLHESHRAFLLLLKDGEYWTLPKIHFESPDQIEAFRNLANNRLTV